jgi:opacity protein-like surface antigen
MTSGDARMRIAAAAVLTSLAIAGPAFAQAPAASPSQPGNKGYAEVVAQSAFGNVTSQSFGGEVGVTIRPGFAVFVDAKAQQIAAGIAANAGATDFHVKQPVTFGVAGVKATMETTTKINPYVVVGGGVAQVKKDVTFAAAGGDLSQFVTVGSDLSGSETKGMISIGGGVELPITRSGSIIVDVQYRYGLIFASGESFNVNRAGAGFGVRF